jgi:hypothetical protein
MVNFFQSQIGILLWCVELGCINIITEVARLSNYLCLPDHGHLDAVFDASAYPTLHHNAMVVFDTNCPTIDMGAFIKTDWKSMRRNLFLLKLMFPVGMEVDLRLFIDSNHAGDQFTRRSRTGFVIYLNMAPNMLFSKRDPNVESSVFGAEFVATKN